MKHEARIIAGLCHPYLPYLFTKKQQCRIVMQFHGVVDHSYPFSITFHCEFHHRKLGLSALEWVVACGQLLEAVSHLHDKILHNDIKSDNIIIGKSLESCSRYPTKSFFKPASVMKENCFS